jgi:hypothetical protein
VKRRVLRFGLGFFTIYLCVMAAAMLSPAVFDIVMGSVGLRFPEAQTPEIRLLVNMNLCGLVPTAFMAARTAIRGEWMRPNRAFFLVMLGANLLINVGSIAGEPAMASILAGDFAVVIVLLVLVAIVPAADASASPRT